jgi:protein-disulfide isomerase
MAKKAEIKKSPDPELKIPTFEVKIKLPQNISWKKFLPKSSSQILVVLLVIAAFLIGVLFTKVQYLEKNQAGAGTQAAVPSQQAAGNQPAQVAPGTKVNVANGHFPVKGNKNAKVTVIEFADFRCPFCEQFFTNTESQLIKDYVDTGKVQFYFRQYAFLGPASVVAADAAECANNQGRFWDFHDYLYKNQPAETDTTMYNTDTLTQAAVSLGMNGNTFRSCLDNKTDDAKASQDMTDGQKVGVSGTPTFFINGVSLVGAQPYSAFQTAINQALAQAK